MLRQSTDPPPPIQDGPVVREPHSTKSGLLGRVDVWQQRHPVIAFPVGVVMKFSDDRADRLAALVAYWGFFSLFPAMLVSVTVLGFVQQNSPIVTQNLADSSIAQFPIIGDSINSSGVAPLTGSTVALVIGLVGALWAGMAAMQAAQDGMNEVWGVTRDRHPTYVLKRLRSLALLLLSSVLIGAAAVLAQLASFVVSGTVNTMALLFATAILNVFIFQVAFKVLTATPITWRQVLPGACVASVAYTVLLTVGPTVVNRVIQRAEKTYGTFALVIGLLTWMYLAAQALMLSAEVNVVSVKQMWPRSLFAERHVVRQEHG